MAVEMISNSSAPVGVILSHLILNYFMKNVYTTCFIGTDNDYRTIFNEHYYHPVAFVADTLENKNFDAVLKSRIDIGCQAFIVNQSLVRVFLDTYHKIKDNCNQRVLQPSVVILWQDQNEQLFSQMVLHHRIIPELPNILVIHQTINASILNLSTIKIETKFNTPSIVQLDSYNPTTKTFQQNANLFPTTKLQNLHERTVKLSTFNYLPYAIWKSVPPGEGNANTLNSTAEKDIWVDGTEILLFLEFCQKFNCTLTIFTDDVGEWGEIFENNTGNGIIGAIYENKVDVGVGALYAWYVEYLYLALSKPITRTGITCFVLKPKLKSRIFMPVYPFSLMLWLAVLASMVIGAIGLELVKLAQKKLNSNVKIKKKFPGFLLDVYKIYLLQSTDLVSNHLAYLSVIGCILLIGLMIGNAYSGGLASVMTVPEYEQAIETVQQLADSNLDWAATHDAWIFSIQSATQPTLKTLVKKFHTYPKEVLARRMEKADLAFSIERLPYGHFAIGEYITEHGLENYQIMLEDIYWEFCLAMSSKTWSLLPLLDDLILRINESGMQKFWELKVVMRHANNKIQLMAQANAKHHDNDAPISLKPSHLFGVFGILMLGVAIASVVFVGELLFFNTYK